MPASQLPGRITQDAKLRSRSDDNLPPAALVVLGLLELRARLLDRIDSNSHAVVRARAVARLLLELRSAILLFGSASPKHGVQLSGAAKQESQAAGGLGGEEHRQAQKSYQRGVQSAVLAGPNARATEQVGPQQDADLGAGLRVLLLLP